MLLSQRPGAGPDLGRHRLVVDLLTKRNDIADLLACDEGERGVAGVVHVRPGLAPSTQFRLTNRKGTQIPPGEELAGRQYLREVVDRRTDHHRVVDVEERGHPA